MKSKTILIVVATLVAASIALTAAAASGSDATTTTDPLAAVRTATAQFRDYNKATDAGYVQFFGCVHEPLAGAMGMHFVNGALVDTRLQISKPEALMYDMKADGTLFLVGVEYVVFKDAWDKLHSAPPRLFGKPFNVVTAPNRYGLPTFYELHAWAWKRNPTGAHEDWNPKVLCRNTEGHVH